MDDNLYLFAFPLFLEWEFGHNSNYRGSELIVSEGKDHSPCICPLNVGAKKIEL